MDQVESFDDADYTDADTVRIVKKHLICPRCGAKTRAYEVAEGARGVRKLCGNCRRMDPDGIGFESELRQNTIKKSTPRARAFYCSIPTDQAIVCCTKTMLAEVNAAGFVGVLAPPIKKEED
ncbi:hypothetical protein MJO47_10050 [Desulfuromonas sp. KJ2020]|uniref:hypothetical protein n=1 Tax=Desulfuromonas sp. KJ2020 TaxID=2919173 RepID=UPI0020A7E1BD|nr:hypothetical protein [Desulfuromonas sp. KJ2020]MCP3177441.1 hypothetical protein [Desulfuromonas sp. KJ2020]